jgi:hypothetical protein
VSNVARAAGGSFTRWKALVPCWWCYQLFGYKYCTVRQFYPAVVVRVNMERKKSKRQEEEAERKVAIEKPELKD